MGTERIWYGDKEQVELGTDQISGWPCLKQKFLTSKPSTCWIKELEAPIAAHQRVGEIQLYDRDKVVAHWPLVTLEAVNKGGLFSRLSDYLHHTL